jgi:putative peptide zinc metalloprotease protein
MSVGDALYQYDVDQHRSQDLSKSFYVIPLSVQKESENYYVGNAELDEFYSFPGTGVDILRMLQEGRTVAEVKSALADSAQDPIDVDEFIDTLIEIGFIYSPDDKHKFEQAVSNVSSGERRLIFKANQGFARAVFSLPTLAIYLSVVGYAAYSAAVDSTLLLNPEAFYLSKHLTATLLLLALLYAFSVSLHELGHMLAAARQGINSKLGFGNRLWQIVAEADMTGLLSLPRKKRYLPMAAGMMVDVFNIAVITIALKWVIENAYDRFAIQLLQAWALQIAITMIWQFNIFLRTDVYYLVCNFYGFTNLDDRARSFLSNQVYTVTHGRFGKRSDDYMPEHLSIARAFFVVWVLGRIAAVWFLLFVVAPTLYRYFERAYDAYRSPYIPVSVVYDLAAFATICAGFLAFGIYVWIKQARNPQ